MKSALFLGAILVLLQGTSSVPADEGIPLELHCIGKSGLDMDEINKYMGSYNTPEDNKGMGKLLVCIWQGKGVMDQEGNINSETLYKFLQARMEVVGSEEVNHVTADEVVLKCHSVSGQGLQQIAIRLNNCINKAIAKI